MKSYKASVFVRQPRHYRPNPVSSEQREIVQNALVSLYRDMGMHDRCWVCEEEIDKSRSKRNRTYAKSCERFGKKMAKRAYGKCGHLCHPKSLRYSIAMVEGKVWNVPVCSEGCHRMATLLYEEKREWLLQAHEWIESAMEQIAALRKFLKTGDREVFQSLRGELRPAETLPLS